MPTNPDAGSFDPFIGSLCRWQSAAIAERRATSVIGRRLTRSRQPVFQLPQHAPPCRFAPFAAAARRRIDTGGPASGMQIATEPDRADCGVK
jgi:hypothetical protein